MRKAGHQAFRQAHQLEQLADPLVAPSTRQPVRVECFAHDVADPQPRVQARIGILEHHLRTTPERLQPAFRKLRDVFTRKADGARGRVDQAQDQPPDRAFAGAGLPDEAEHLARPDRKAHAVHGAHRMQSVPEMLGQFVDLEKRRAHAISLQRRQRTTRWTRPRAR